MRKGRTDWLTRNGKTVGLLTLNLAVQPRPGVDPLTFCRGRGDAQGVGGFLDGQAGEVAELDQPGLGRVFEFELLQGLVEGQEVVGRLFVRGGEPGSVLDVHASHVAAALLALSLT